MAPTKVAVTTGDAPAAIGPYSQAVRTGDFLFASGQIPLDPATGALVEGGIGEQTERVIANIRGLLLSVNLGMEDVVKTTVFLQDMNDFAAMNILYAAAFATEGTVPPARSTVQVARLPKDALVEIEIIARFPDSRR